MKKKLIIMLGCVVVLTLTMILVLKKSSQPIITIFDKDNHRKTQNPENISSKGATQLNEQIGMQKQQIAPFGIISSSKSKLSYDEAVKMYQNSMLQFDESCQLTTKSRSFVLGNEVMIDNRGPKPRTITIGTASIVLGPYDYGFMTLEQRGTSVVVDCEDRKNTANLIVQ